MITKQDWENARKQFEALLVNAQINIETYKAALRTINKKIEAYEDDDEEDNEVKEKLKEIIE